MLRTGSLTADGGATLLGQFSLPENDPRTCGTQNGTFSSHCPTLFHDLGLVTRYSGGLRAVDLADPAHLHEDGAFVPRPTFTADLRDNRLFFPRTATGGTLPTDTVKPGSTTDRWNGAMWSYPVVQNASCTSWTSTSGRSPRRASSACSAATVLLTRAPRRQPRTPVMCCDGWVTFFDALAGHPEEHRTGRAGWLRAAVLGANDGLVSTSSLMVGVAASRASTGAILTAGIAGLAAGAMAMAAGEYVSVSAQSDIERADRELEISHLAADPPGELEELTQIYEARGLPRELAEQVAVTLHEKDPLAAHLRDELGQHESTQARPMQAATASAISFTLGGLVPFLGMLAHGEAQRLGLIVAVTVLGLAVAGLLGARAAGTGLLRPTLRVLLGGTAAMLVTAVIGRIAHVSGI